MPIELTRGLAFAASLDAGDRAMRQGKRTVWSEEDANVASAEFSRLWPLCVRRMEPGACWFCEETANTASLQIDSSVPGADIEIDGAFAGNTPSTLSVAPGQHTSPSRKRATPTGPAP